MQRGRARAAVGRQVDEARAALDERVDRDARRLAAHRAVARRRTGRALRVPEDRGVHADAGAAGQVLADAHRVADRLGHDRDGGAGRRQHAERARQGVEVDGALRDEHEVDAGGLRDLVGEVAVGRAQGLDEERPAGQRAPGHAQLVDGLEREADRGVHADGAAGPRDVAVDRRRHEAPGHGVGEHPRPERGAVAADHDQGVEAERLDRLEAGVAAGGRLELLPAARAEPRARLVRARPASAPVTATTRRSASPAKPPWMPQTSPPSRSARSHAPAIAAFMPGASPPLVRTPRRRRHWSPLLAMSLLIYHMP